MEETSPELIFAGFIIIFGSWFLKVIYAPTVSDEKKNSVDIQVRRCTALDKAQVIGPLSEGVYVRGDGRSWDYLPRCFDRWLRNPVLGKHMFVAEDLMTNTIVGLETISLFDAEESVMFQSMRTLKRYRGRGIARLLSAKTAELLSTVAPKAKTLRTSTLWPKLKTSVRIFHEQGYCSILYKPLCAYSFITDSIDSLQQHVSKSSIKPISSENIYGLLTDPANQDLIPSGLLFVNWEAFSIAPKVLKQNLEYLNAQGMQFYGSFSTDGMIVSLSIGSVTQRVCGMIYQCSIMGRCNDSSAFVDHLCFHTWNGHQKGANSMQCQYDQCLEFGENPYWHSGDGGDSLRNDFDTKCLKGFRDIYPCSFEPFLVQNCAVLMQKKL